MHLPLHLPNISVSVEGIQAELSDRTTLEVGLGLSPTPAESSCISPRPVVERKPECGPHVGRTTIILLVPDSSTDRWLREAESSGPSFLPMHA
jgi:hypothetical protein